jgi:aspartate/methionine/tyrosine aminotransferase
MTAQAVQLQALGAHGLEPQFALQLVHLLRQRLGFGGVVEQFDAVLAILKPVLDVQNPDGGYLWPKVNGDDASFCLDLFVEEHVTVVPGSYLSREVDGFNSGAGRVEAAERIRAFITRNR